MVSSLTRAPTSKGLRYDYTHQCKKCKRYVQERHRAQHDEECDGTGEWDEGVGGRQDAHRRVPELADGAWGRAHDVRPAPARSHMLRTVETSGFGPTCGSIRSSCLYPKTVEVRAQLSSAAPQNLSRQPTKRNSNI